MDTKVSKEKSTIVPQFKRLPPVGSKQGLALGRWLRENDHGHLRRNNLNAEAQIITDFMDPDNPSPEQDEVRTKLIEKDERWWISFSAYYYGVPGSPRNRPLTFEEIGAAYRPSVNRTECNKFKAYAHEFIYDHMPEDRKPKDQ